MILLRFIGVGPGDPELLTLKAARLLREADAIALPDRGAARGIAREWIEGKPVLELALPMRGVRADWELAHARAVARLLEWLDRYEAVAFPVLGDPSIYATSSYLYRRVSACHPCEIVPGVPAMCAAAAALGVPLCEQGERLTVLDRLDGAPPEGNAVLMKAGRSLGELRAAPGREIYIVRNLGMTGEWLGELADAPEDGSSYFTTAIIKQRE